MRGTDLAQLAWRAVRAQRLRSGLTLLGIAVGIAAVILLTSIGEGIHRFVLAEFTQFGTNIIGITPGKVKTSGPAPTGIPSSVRPLTLEDAELLARLPHVIGVSPTVWGNTEVGANGRLRRSTVSGVGPDMLRVYQMRVRTGQFLPADGLENARAFVVLGARLKTELFGNDNPLGQRVRLGAAQFRVIGVLEPKGQFLGIDLDDAAYVPVARHGREDFTLVTQEDMLRTLSNILDILTMAVGALGGISLLVGAVGIATIMTIAVRERTSEIGLLVALGATQRTILGLFLGEAVALSALGGAVGLGAGLGLAQLLHLAVPALPVHTPLHFALAAQALAIAIGLAAGVLPARAAARLDPVQALRAQ